MAKQVSISSSRIKLLVIKCKFVGELHWVTGLGEFKWWNQELDKLIGNCY